MDELLAGGVANAGAVVRRGDQVLKPAPANATAIHALLRYVRERGFEGVPEPFAIDSDGRERLSFIAGDVPVPPFPAWAQSDETLASTAALLRRFHDAAEGFVPPPEADWNTDLADPSGGPVICHNDVCPENVVYRDGVAVALLDFEYAAPGRPVHDLSALARVCIPLDDEPEAALQWPGPFDPIRRLRVVADAYGLSAGRDEFFEVIAAGFEAGGRFVQRHVEAGHPAFVEMWDRMGGMARFDRRRAWFAAHRTELRAALG
jgi:aminoglycoside phosphotransferase (APT) family kinase protein